jgi:glucose/mannose transport system permease protein
MRNRNDLTPIFALTPSLIATLVFVYGAILWTIGLSFTSSRLFPVFDFVGLETHMRLWALPNWLMAIKNLIIFTVCYIGFCIIIGLSLAILLDQHLRGERIFQTIYLYPMAISFIVAGTAWKWMLNPGLGLEKTMHDWGWTSFTFDWLINPNRAIYTVVIAAVWQTSGFVMVLFLSGLRAIDPEVIKAAKMDGASGFLLYRRIIIPLLRPIFLSATVVLTHMSIKAYDLVIALTNGGPGNATEMPSTFMYSYTFTRNQLALGAASATAMLALVLLIIGPYIYGELRKKA